MKPVQDVCGLSVQTAGQRPQHGGTIREKSYLLIGLQALRAQYLEYAPVRLGIDFLHRAKVFGCALRRNASARNYLETAFFTLVLDVAAVEADH